MIDFRSDTVTKPTKQMLDAMCNAEVGDDGYQEDPTVNELEYLVAKLLGKEEALFVTSGTQGNQIAILAQTNPGEEIIVEANSHIYRSELDAVESLARVRVIPLTGNRGELPIVELKKRLENPNCNPSLIAIENTHARASGAVLPMEHLKAVYELAKSKATPVHLDGARLFHATVALGVHVKELAQFADTVTICLSKGLAAPVGSVLAGSEAFIQEARKWRKRLGGRMRQAGYLAAPGIYTLKHGIDCLEQDHRRAKVLATEISKLTGLSTKFPVDTNILLVELNGLPFDAHQLTEKLHEFGILVKTYDKDVIRMVLHKDINDRDVEHTIESLKSVLNENN